MHEKKLAHGSSTDLDLVLPFALDHLSAFAMKLAHMCSGCLMQSAILHELTSQGWSILDAYLMPGSRQSLNGLLLATLDLRQDCTIDTPFPQTFIETMMHLGLVCILEHCTVGMKVDLLTPCFARLALE
jgi:hypothetical protein